MSESTEPRSPTYPHLLWFFVPLALSSSLMTLEPLIISTALSRAPNAELTLAAYNVMFGIALVIEAPVIMLVSASTALSRSRESFQRLFRFMLALSGSVVGIGFVIALTPLYGWLVLDLMRIPPPVADLARPALVVMSVWSFPVAWRRTLQGVLINHDRTPTVTMATVVRLAALIVALLVGERLAPDRMLLVGAWAMQISVVTEALVITGPAVALVRRLPSDANAPRQATLTWRGLVRFYQPLAIMMVLRQIGRPLLSAGIAAARLPQRSLAAWSVAWSTVLLPYGMTMGLEQLAIAKSTSPGASARVRRFVWGVGLVLTGALAIVVYTPLVHPVLALLFDLTPEVELLVIQALQWTALLPLLQSLQGRLRGIAIGAGRTSDARTAVAASLAVVALLTIVGPRVVACTGVLIGAVATMASALMEVGWLAWRDWRAIRRVAAPVAAEESR